MCWLAGPQRTSWSDLVGVRKKRWNCRRRTLFLSFSLGSLSHKNIQSKHPIKSFPTRWDHICSVEFRTTVIVSASWTHWILKQTAHFITTFIFFLQFWTLHISKFHCLRISAAAWFARATWPWSLAAWIWSVGYILILLYFGYILKAFLHAWICKYYDHIFYCIPRIE